MVNGFVSAIFIKQLIAWGELLDCHLNAIHALGTDDEKPLNCSMP